MNAFWFYSDFFNLQLCVEVDVSMVAHAQLLISVPVLRDIMVKTASMVSMFKIFKHNFKLSIFPGAPGSLIVTKGLDRFGLTPD